MGVDGYLYFCTFLQTDIVTLLIFEFVFDPHFGIKFLAIVDFDLSLLRFVILSGNNFLDLSGQSYRRVNAEGMECLLTLPLASS